MRIDRTYTSRNEIKKQGKKPKPDISIFLTSGILLSDIVVAYIPKGADDYESSKINLGNPGINNAVDGSSPYGTPPSWTKEDGWIFDGVNNYLDTGIFATTDYSVICQFDSTIRINGLKSLFGSSNTPFCFLGYAVDRGNGYSNFFTQHSAMPIPIFDKGVIGTYGLMANTNNTIFDFTPFQSLLHANFQDFGLTFLIGGSYNFDDEEFTNHPMWFSKAKILKLAVYNKTLTQEQALNITNKILNE